MRGKVRAYVLILLSCRITPAYAGKRSFVPVVMSSQIGSPPPMRGKETHTGQSTKQHGITPAYAGKSPMWYACCLSQRDHPRLCGEKAAITVASTFSLGSPPPMRGKVFLAPLVLSVIRITPAYAGKSTQILWNCFFDQDHPRLCGEKGSWKT